MIKRWGWMIAVMLMSVAVTAQDMTCPTLQQQALANVSEFCAEQTANTLCYGHPTVSVVYNDVADETLQLTAPGNTIPLTSIDWFSTSNEANTWGTARAFLQVYSTDSIVPKPATLVTFGNTVLFNLGTDGITLQTVDIEISATQGANIRALPTTDGRVIEPVLLGTVLTAVGRSDNGAWIQVYTNRGEVGWVSVGAIDGDIDVLETVSPDDDPEDLIPPLQALSLQTGIADADCADVPESGVLVQASSEGSPSVFYINGVTLELSGTAFLQAQPETGMLVHVLDGTGVVRAGDGEQTIETGYVSRVFVALDDEGALYPTEAPATPLVYNYDVLSNLPIELLPVSARVGIDIYTLVSPRPVGGESPIAGMALDAPCKFTTGQTGANIRAEPSPSAPIIAVMGYRESAEPIARAVGLDGLPWWQLADGVWIRIDTTVTGGDCASVPRIEYEG